MTRSKRYLKVAKLVDKNKIYSIDHALELVKQTSLLKFDSTVELVFHLNINLKNIDQNLCGSIVLPSGTGKKQKILVITNTKKKEAIESKSDFVGGQEIIEKIKNGWFGFDIIIATPEMMLELGKIGKLLGPKGLMPTTKLGTVTIDISKIISEIRKGRIKYRIDKYGNMHFIIGKVSFSQKELKDNYLAIFDNFKKNNNLGVKISYIKSINISTSMGPSIKVLI